MLSKHLAQKIVDQIMADVDYNINIMDETGMIMASGDEKRIGMIHQGAKKVMISKERNFIYEDTLTEKKGINDPIFIDNKCVGVVGISGPPEEVLKIKNVVNTLFYFLISRESEISQQYTQKEIRQNVIRKLIYHHSELSYDEILFLKENQIQLLDEIIVCVIEGKLKAIPEKRLFYQKSNKLVVLLTTKKEIKQVGSLQKMLDKNFEKGFRCGFSKMNNRVNDSYQQALGTLRFMNIFQQEKTIQSYEENKFFVDTLLSTELFGLDKDIDKKIFVVLNDDVLSETLLTFIDYNCHMKNTADKLIVHRNTLNYRLNKIKKITGYDPYTFKGLTNLAGSLIIFKKNNQEKYSD